MKLGSLASNPNKLRVMNLLLKKSLELNAIAKAIRLPKNALKSIIDELITEGFIEEEGGYYKITDLGKRTLKSLR